MQKLLIFGLSAIVFGGGENGTDGFVSANLGNVPSALKR